MDVFLDYHGVDVDEAQRLAQDLQADGHQVIVDDGSIVPERAWLRAVGDRGLRAPLLLLYASPRTPSEWLRTHQSLSLAQHAWADRDGRPFSVLPVLSGGRTLGDEHASLKQWTGATLPDGRDRNAAIAQLSAALDRYVQPTPLDAEAVQRVMASGPFPGLRAFNEARATLFMGRDEAIRQCLQRIDDGARWLQVEGASGVGKTSLVRAGLLVALQVGDRAPFGPSWRHCVVRPGVDPINDLALALHKALEIDPAQLPPAELAHRLHEDERALVKFVEEDLPQLGHRGLLLILDQLDDGFTQQPLNPERFEPFDKLIARSIISNANLRLVTTVRSDRLNGFRTMPQLEGQLNLPTTARFHLPPLRDDDLRAAIVDPVHLLGATVDDALVEELIRLAEEEPVRLPKVAVVLRALWRDAVTRDPMRPKMMLSDLEPLRATQARPSDGLEEPYEGLRNVFSRVMDQSLDGLSQPELEAARDMMIHVVRPGRVGNDMRCMRPRGEVYHGTDHLKPEQARHVLEKLAGPTENRRPSGLEPFRVIEMIGTSGDTESLDLRHDVLLTDWRILAFWLEEAREFLERRDELLLLEAKADPFADGPLQEPLVVRLAGEDLDDNTKVRYLRSLDADSRSFIEELQRRRPLPTRSGRIPRGVVALVAVAVVALVVAGVWVVRNQRQLADDSRMQAVRIATAEVAPHAARILLSGVRAPEQQPRWPDAVVEALERPAVKRALVGHGAEILDLALSDDGQMLAAGCADGAVLWWNVDEPAAITQLKAHEAAVRSIDISPDGKWLASASHDRTAKIFTLDGSAEPIVLQGHGGPLTMVDIGPRGRRVLTSSHDGTVRLWRRDGTLEGALEGHQGWVSSVEMSEDGRHVLTAGQDGTARVWELQPGRDRPPPTEAVVLQHPGGFVQPAHFSPDGMRVLTGSGNDLRVWDWSAEEGPVSEILGRHEGGLLSARFDATSEWVVSTGRDRTVKAWSFLEASRPEVLELDSTLPRLAVFAPSGVIMVAVEGGQVWQWRPGDPDIRAVYGSGRTEVRDIVFRADAREMITGTADGVARIWSLDQRLVPEMVEPEAALASAWFGDAGDSRIFTTLQDGGVRVYDRSTDALTDVVIDGVLGKGGVRPGGSQVITLDQGVAKVWPLDGQTGPRTVGRADGPVAQVAYSPDGSIIAALGEDGVLRLYKADGGSEVRSLRLRRESVTAFGFDPDGSRIVTGGSNGSVQVWTILGDFPIKTFEGLTSSVEAVSMSGDDKVAAGGVERVVRVWSVADPEFALILEGHQGTVRNVSLNANGVFLLTLADDRVARLWRLESPDAPLRTSQEDCSAIQASLLSTSPRVVVACRNGPAELWNPRGQAMRLSGDGAPVAQVAFSADGSELLTTSEDGAVAVWPASVDELRGALLADVEPCLTPGERVHFLEEDVETALARWRGCVEACWGQTFNDELSIESFRCLVGGGDR
ncbi:MAG: TIR domain-containing protein [Myxococcota bacterium]